MNTQSKVLITDDDKFVRGMLTRFLKDEYDIRTAENGLECMGLASQWQPDIILLDVEMPDQNGYEVCEQLKGLNDTNNIPVVFLSSKSSLRERMLGYEAGADDYLIKSSTADELKAKLKKITAINHEKRALVSDADSAQKTAMEAMSTSFELGKAVRFAERSYTAGSFDTLGKYLMEFMNDLQLSAVAMFTCQQGEFYYSSNASEVKPLEIELMQMLHSNQRFNDFGCRTQINYPHIALLVKNMPLEDRARYGRLKDTFPFVMGTANAKVGMLDSESLFMRQSAEMAASIEQVKDILDGLKCNIHDNLQGVSQSMSSLITSLSVELVRMGLEDDQEQFIFHKVEEISEQLHECMGENDSINQNLEEIVAILKKLTADQNQVVKNLFFTSEKEADASVEDIELF